MDQDIHVTRTFLPPLSEYRHYLERIWQSGYITNQGPLVHELESELKKYLGANGDLQFVTNGTLALQLALRTLDITRGEVITTPFSYVATISSILWEHCQPVFVDIDPQTLCIDPKKIKDAITPQTKAIMPVHVFGNPCDIEAIAAIAKDNKLKVIYDGAHAFGVRYNGKSLLTYGDLTICSFHATKLFHTIEGGAVILNDTSLAPKLDLLKRFGHLGDDYYQLGINAKASELQAAMGLCNLEFVDDIIVKRHKLSELYDQSLGSRVQRPKLRSNTSYNYAYYPILLSSEQQLKKVTADLNAKHIFPRRYFYPALNTLPYLDKQQSCPIAEDVATRILCLPLYNDLEPAVVKQIAQIVKS